MLSPVKHEVDITNVNLRKEKHGTERKLAVDISYTLTASNDILDTLEPGLKSSFFRKPGKGAQLDAFTDKDALVEVKHPALGTIKIDGKYPGYEMELVGLLDNDSQKPFFLPDVELKDFSFDAMEGGSVALHFKVGASVEPDDLVEIGEYYTRAKVRLTLQPPTTNAAADAAKQDSLDMQDSTGEATAAPETTEKAAATKTPKPKKAAKPAARRPVSKKAGKKTKKAA